MSGKQISESELIASLNGLRMPDITGNGVSDLFAAIAIGGAIALILFIGLRFLTRPYAGKSAFSVQEALQQSSKLRDDQRRHAVYRLLVRHEPELASGFERAVYNPREPFDFAKARSILLSGRKE